MECCEYFSDVQRQAFRRYFQPSRIVLGLLPAPTDTGVNVITLCFDMYCSYKPAMMAFAIQNSCYSHECALNASECVLAVPGESMAETTMFCGLESGRRVDKIRARDLTLSRSKTVEVPGISTAIANIELVIRERVPTGDHLTVLCEVRRFAVNKGNREQCLLSVGPEHEGYDVLETHGIHRIAVVSKRNK